MMRKGTDHLHERSSFFDLRIWVNNGNYLVLFEGTSNIKTCVSWKLKGYLPRVLNIEDIVSQGQKSLACLGDDFPNEISLLQTHKS